MGFGRLDSQLYNLRETCIRDVSVTSLFVIGRRGLALERGMYQAAKQCHYGVQFRHFS